MQSSKTCACAGGADACGGEEGGGLRRKEATERAPQCSLGGPQGRCAAHNAGDRAWKAKFSEDMRTVDCSIAELVPVMAGGLNELCDRMNALQRLVHGGLHTGRLRLP